MNKQYTPLVSVIISFLNEEVFLAEAIESVIQQHYSKWELILIDDGSSDYSTNIAKKFAQISGGQIIYTDHKNHTNKGLSASRNHGISIASGELIAFLDADDIWYPWKLQVQVSLMQLHTKVAMLCEASEYWYYNSEDKSKEGVIIQIGKERDRVFFPPELLKVLYPLSNGSAPCPSGIIIRRAAIIKHGGFEEHFSGIYQLYEDQAFLHKIYLNEPVYLSSLCNNRYRQREGSLVRRITDEGNYNIVRRYFLEWLEEYVKQIGFYERTVNNLIIKALEPYRRPYLYILKTSIYKIWKVFVKSMLLY